MSKLDEIIELVAETGRSWTHDQLDGTSHLAESLAAIDGDTDKAKIEIKILMLDIFAETLKEGDGDLSKMADLYSQKVKAL